ncbi:aminotransferase class I/II-fold pyridoxal phosphate-dependent enzyme [Herbiconiux sp. CPCC 203407]|uniref:homocysteine desulfhydrase n=1 Tax=Herbiconiux oxytropis TaxID=2970915 RepID=A0AA41XIE1_9MICO|nr:aminotransferase class I/II-fold pyridoxal phosphate-dependent enzyme [Herbiconiux oxytropis]MCS5723628.1 aminotransferase class I/II-fold pyridoxal phosphate-dependent enzyme [Herbiconiux oxytropis]MCS5726945.1 aminotransferase class I/II-fold pyridoxal phosphate-dependent enzyme [Herbiconiux oxytropis]
MTPDAPDDLAFETRQIHAGAIIDAEANARITPIYQSAGYVFDSFDDGEARFAGRGGRAYSRNDNPTNAVATRRLANLEGGVDAVLVASGQAAIAAALFALASAGDHILTTDSLYEGTREMFRGALKRQGLEFTALPADAPEEEWLAAVTSRTKAIYTETIPNPLGDVVDLERLGRVAERAGVPLVVDNTVATPYLNRPFEWGAHIVIHSTSKWLAGHGAVIGGAVIDSGRFDWSAQAERFPQLTTPPRPGVGSFVERFGDSAYLAYLRSVVVLEYGPTVPPTSTFLLLHGLETLSLRMERHVENAQAVAEALEGHPALSRVLYPGLPSDPHHALAQKYLPRGAGSVLAIELAGGRDAARTFFDALTLVSRMTHIGDVRTLAIHTGSTIHSKLTEEERLAIGITPGLVRLSIGLESPRDIVTDLLRALDSVAGPAPGS